MKSTLKQSEVIYLNAGDNFSLQNQGGVNFLEAIKARAIKEIGSLLAEMLDGVDDALFDQSEKLTADGEQDQYFEAMRELRIKRKGIKNIFGNELQNHFDQLSRRKTIEKSGFSSQDTLSLVQDDELEENLAIDAMVHKARKQNHLALIQLTTRFKAAIQIEQIDVGNNPIEPRNVMGAFLEACKTLDLPIRFKLIILKLFERGVANHLDYVYSELNQFLISKGVLPELPKVPIIKRPMVNRPGQAQAALVVDEKAEGVNNELLNVLRQILAVRKPDEGVTNSTPAVSSKELIHALSNIQLSTSGQLVKHQDIRAKIASLLPISGPVSHKSIGHANDDVIDIISMLFEFILDDDNLPSELKALIGRLQIPLLKVAIIDESFFSTSAHPARKLLNELAKASLGWSPTGNGKELLQKIEHIVVTINKEFKDDPKIFEEQLQDFTQYYDQIKSRAHLVEQRTRQTEEGKALAASAKHTVDQTLSELLDEAILPKSVNQLLNEAWKNVMLLALLKNGVESSEWKSAVNTAKNLMLSLSPPADDLQRQLLMKTLGSLVTELRSGLELIAYSEFETSYLFQELERCHLKVLKGESVIQYPEPEPEIVRLSQPEFDISGATENRAEKVNSHNATDPQILQTTEQELEFDLDLDQEIALSEKALEQLDELYLAVGNEAQYEEIAPVIQNIEETINEAPLSMGWGEADDPQGVKGRTHQQKSQKIQIADEELEPYLHQIDQFQVSNWFELTVSESEPKLRIRLAAIIPTIGKYVFVNRTGIKVADYLRTDLAKNLQRGDLRLLNDGVLFDRALESIVSNLRSLKQKQGMGF